MEMNGISAGAATYVMKKAMEMPNILINLIQNSAPAGNQPLATGRPVTSPNEPDLAAVTGKGKILDIVA
jgi:hypothetical protein